MTQEAVEKVLGRMLTDDAFRFRTKKSLYTTCLEEGYPLSEEEGRLIRRLDFARLDTLAKNLDSGLKRFAVGNKKILDRS